MLLIKRLSLRRLYHSSPRVAVSVVITDPDLERVVLVQRKNEPNKGKWALPGGKIKIGERTIQAGLREVREETGLRIHEYISPFVFDSTDIIIKSVTKKEEGEGDYYQWHYVINHLFAIIPYVSEDETLVKLPSLKANSDALACKWINVHDIRESKIDLASENMKNVIDRAFLLYKLKAFSIMT